MNDWMPFNSGLPNVIIKELEIHYGEGTISAATYGRGIWQSPLNTFSNVDVDNTEEVEFLIYPNPTKSKITVSSSDKKEISVSLFSLAGKKILERNCSEISVSHIAKGCYIAKITHENGIKIERLIIK